MLRKHLLDPRNDELGRRDHRAILPSCSGRIEPRYLLQRFDFVHLLDLRLRESASDEDCRRNSGIGIVEVGTKTRGGYCNFAFQKRDEFGSADWRSVNDVHHWVAVSYQSSEVY